MNRPLLTTLSPIPRRRRFRDALATVLAAAMLAALFCGCLLPMGCKSAPDRRVRDVPAWTNAIPYHNARPPSWGPP